MPNNKQKKGKAPKRAAATITVRAAARPRPKQGKNAKKKAARRSTGNQLQLSPCAVDYAHALLNPCGAVPCCMPTIGGVSSRKMKPFARGTLATSNVLGNEGNGFILVSPSLGLASDNIWALTSNTTWPGPNLPLTWAAGTGILAVGSNSDYTLSALNNGAAARVVGTCIKLRYAGTELNRGGAVFGLCEPDHLSLLGKNLPAFRQYTQCAETRVTDAWTEVIYTGPVNPTEFEYNNSLFLPSIVPNSQPMMGFFIRSATAGVLFDFEIYAIYEVIGPTINGKTPSYADPVGLNVVTNGAMNASTMGQVGHHGSGGFLTKAIGAMGKIAGAAITHVGGGGSIGVDVLMKALLPRLTARALPAIMGASM